MKHVSEKLSAYINQELANVERQEIETHLRDCQRCRREFEEINFGVELAQQLKRADAPRSVWTAIENALEKQEQEENHAPAFLWFRHRGFALACVAVSLVCLSAIAYLLLKNPPTDATTNAGKNENASLPSWQVESLAGAPKAGKQIVKDKGSLSVGELLETDSNSKARIEVANIGYVDIAPNSRVRFVGSKTTEHRLALDRGRLQAQINAPPRLFVVDTPSAVAVDLGCEYTLDVDAEGNSLLHVTRGWVALMRDERESIVPAGAICQTQRGIGPGTPYFDDVSDEFREALTKFDFQNGGTAALKIIIAEARAYDTLTLWHLLSRTSGKDRKLVYDAIASFVEPPKGVTREGILKLDQKMLGEWRAELETLWFD
jgi:hypothetical protein